ncbi:MAG: hypothetical protein Tsb0014_39260 [Pleurocapsa sp.]
MIKTDQNLIGDLGGAEALRDRKMSHSQGDRRKETVRNKRFWGFFVLGQLRNIPRQKQKAIFNKAVFNNSVECNSNREIIISNSGQNKIDNLDSCLNLVGSDFIVY